MNDEEAHYALSIVKEVIAFAINVVFVVLLAAVILAIFTLKSTLIIYEYPQSTITAVPAILIAITTQLFNYLYNKMIGILVEFENKKTIPEYETALTSKSFIVTFVVTYFAIFVYAFFSQYFQADTACSILTSSGRMYNYFNIE
jgi:hypothetical protein